MSNRSFEKLLLEAVDEGLSSLGDSAKQVIYFYLEKTSKIDRRDIPYRIEEFADAIEKFFGVGAKVLKILIMKRLYEKIGGIVEYDQEHGDLVFTEYIAAARQTFLKKKKRAQTATHTTPASEKTNTPCREPKHQTKKISS